MQIFLTVTPYQNLRVHEFNVHFILVLLFLVHLYVSVEFYAWSQISSKQLTCDPTTKWNKSSDLGILRTKSKNPTSDKPISVSRIAQDSH